MNAPEPLGLPDVQSAADVRNIAITSVGIKSLRYPIVVASAHGPVTTVASIDMYVALPPEKKGTHMSRFIEVLQEPREPLTPQGTRALLTRMLSHLGADAGTIELRFPYFVTKAAPVSGVQSLMDYEVILRAGRRRGLTELRQAVVVPVTSLCPCSKEISDYGAHNQRTHVIIDLTLAEPMSIEDQIRIGEQAASSELWAVLKRSDEKFVTEHAYDNPKFVEDTVRDIAVALNRDARVLAYRVSSENFEAIHNHSAYALIEHDKRDA
jgi:GTP cyclohydrolase I